MPGLFFGIKKAANWQPLIRENRMRRAWVYIRLSAESVKGIDSAYRLPSAHADIFFKFKEYSDNSPLSEDSDRTK